MVRKIDIHKNLFSKPIIRWTLALSILGLLASGANIVYGIKLNQFSSNSATLSSAELPTINSVTALGRLEPEGKTIQLAPPPNLGGAKVIELLVKEGDIIKANQVVAVLENRDFLEASVEQAQEEVKVAQANLAIVQAGAKSGEIQSQKATIKQLEAQLQGEKIRSQARIRRLQGQLQGEKLTQQATIDRLQAELNNAQREYERHQKLAENGAISVSELDSHYLTLESAKKNLKEAQATFNQTVATLGEELREEKANAQQINDTLSQQIQAGKADLDRISEVRDVDVYKAEAEITRAMAALKRAKRELELTYVRSPIDSRVLKIYTYPGETVSSEQGIVELGRTDQMMVIAEVYESDITQVKPGQTVEIKSENGTFSDQLEGTVSEVGWLINRQGIFETDPATDVDNRVVEVKIKLNKQDSTKVSQLTYSRVIAKILL
ncbi:MAG: HlyD family efflux transporter periplasmic adaptor subunit [Crocosphaera sp.]|nr:HlyD family efflux transporter periplasmic adaptor subunit [Crocosphaera sp.]